MKYTLLVILSSERTSKSYLFTCAGASVPIRKLEFESGIDDEVGENPKGEVVVRTTLLSGIVAFERTVTAKVTGAPETTSVSASTDTESGVDDIVSA